MATNEKDEIHDLKERVDCRTVLEAAGFTFYPEESSRHVWKYSRKHGVQGHQIVIVNHHGKGWFSPLEVGKRGDVFSLVQYLNPGLNFGQVRIELRPLAGIAPRLPAGERESSEQPVQDLLLRWNVRSKPVPGSAAWKYLATARKVPEDVIERAVSLGILAEGPYGTMWAAHLNKGIVGGWEMRGEKMKSAFCRGGTKSLLQFSWGDTARCTRLAVTEAAIDAFSLAALEGRRVDTIYASTGGGMAPHTIQALQGLCMGLNVVVATDANAPGDRYANMIQPWCRKNYERLRPVGYDDWNDCLRAER
ncbi:DUF3991 and TOPRIM domain-containing protein [Acetobacter persici]|uniref:DUF3991 and TOPRIM domain-containing protein n=1 Tax=Acetobacter persici TaxID=1076596 RepID=UPI001BA87842|nr:DUF3991 and TOPRIM domain-containing protein [Acetobacter persici]MBS1017096.1 DUF3991 and TOPRIM domain-containing protein [Acetobacter persici]